MNARFCTCLLGALLAARGAAQSAGTRPGDPVEDAIDKRLGGVLPNYKTADGSKPFQPITAKQKLTIAYKDSFDYPVFGIAGLFAGISQLRDQHPSYGQGMAGFAKRYAAAYADQTLGNFMTEGILPSLLHQDPRYFRIGAGRASGGARARHALSQVFITRTDSGSRTFNFAEVGGYLASTGIANAYYPDSRRLSSNLIQVGTLMAWDVAGNMLKEFLPDLKQRMARRRQPKR